MRLGLQVPIFNWPDYPASIAPTMRNIAQTAERHGYYSLWLMDHFFQLGGSLGPYTDPMLEGYTTLGYAAAVTERIKLGLMVTGNIYRYPAVLVKTVTTLDVLSGGRAYFGIGAGWYEKESVALGLPSPHSGVRFEWLEETLQITQKMFSGDSSPYHGDHFTLAEPVNSPAPMSQPHPPILIGGTGEKKTLRMVAQYGDACNIFFDFNSLSKSVPFLQRKLTVLRKHCDRLGRNYDDIEKTVLGTIDLEKMSVAEVLTAMQALADSGIDHTIFNLPQAHTLTAIEVMGREVLPKIADW